MAFNSGNEPLSALQFNGLAQFKATIVVAFKQEKGDVKRSAQALGVDRSTLNRWIAKYPDVKRALAEVRAKAASEKTRAADA